MFKLRLAAKKNKLPFFRPVSPFLSHFFVPLPILVAAFLRRAHVYNLQNVLLLNNAHLIIPIRAHLANLLQLTTAVVMTSRIGLTARTVLVGGGSVDGAYAKLARIMKKTGIDKQVS